MAKQNKGTHASRQKPRKRMWQGIFTAVVLAGLVSVFMVRDRFSSADGESAGNGPVSNLLSTSASLRNRIVLPAMPRRPRPVTLDPNNYTEPETKAAYQAAKDVPEVLENMPCYCGCFSDSGHRSNLECYRDNHGVT